MIPIYLLLTRFTIDLPMLHFKEISFIQKMLGFEKTIEGLIRFRPSMIILTMQDKVATYLIDSFWPA